MPTSSKTSSKSKESKTRKANQTVDALDQTQESEKMTKSTNNKPQTAKDILKAAIEEESINETTVESAVKAVVNYDFTDWIVNWHEWESEQTHAPYGYVDLISPDCPTFEDIADETRKGGVYTAFQQALDADVATHMGKGKQKFQATVAASAFSSLCQFWYSHVEPGFILGGNYKRSDDAAAYVASSHSGSITVNGKTITAEVPEGQAIQAFKGDAILGLIPDPLMCIQAKDALITVRKQDDMTKFEMQQMKTFWKAHALMSFASYQWVRIYFGPGTRNYIAKCIENRLSREATAKAIEESMYNKRQQERDAQTRKQVARGQTPTYYGGEEKSRNPVYLVFLEDFDGKFGTLKNKVELNEETVKTLNGQIYKTVKIEEGDVVRAISAFFPQDENDLAEMYETCAYNNRSLLLIK